MKVVTKPFMQKMKVCRKLHFSRHLLKRLEIKGVKFAEVTCWFRTFNPVEVEDLSKHKMDSEELKIAKALAVEIVK